MKRVVMSVIAAILAIGGVAAVGISVVHFVNAVPVGASVSAGEIGLYLPWYAAPGVLAAALGLILLAARKFF